MRRQGSRGHKLQVLADVWTLLLEAGEVNEVVEAKARRASVGILKDQLHCGYKRSSGVTQEGLRARCGGSIYLETETRLLGRADWGEQGTRQSP